MEEALEMLNNPEERENFESFEKVKDLKNGLCKDYWDNQIILVINSLTEYKLVSYGYNGKNDEGKEDDIVLIFNPSGSDFKNKPNLFYDGTSNN